MEPKGAGGDSVADDVELPKGEVELAPLPKEDDDVSDVDMEDPPKVEEDPPKGDVEVAPFPPKGDDDADAEAPPNGEAEDPPEGFPLP